jgi:hypothetical protein
MKKWVYILSSFVVILLILFLVLLFLAKNRSSNDATSEVDGKSKTEALMLLIEFEGTEGLVNFVNNIKDRDIPALLIASPDFVIDNCNSINTILSFHDVEIAGLDASKPLWDVPYEEQLSIMKETRDRIKECTGEDIKVFGSKYFAYDENTVKAAEELGIEYVLARGTTGAKATIYKPTEYDVKIFSVSNVDSQNWGTGSLCDYSYWAREGRPEDFQEELFNSLKYEKISPVSHTYIGGMKKLWNDVYLKFFDEADIEWVGLDQFGEVDINSSFKDIPDNREVKYDTPHPAIPLEEEENVSNPCAVENLTLLPTQVEEKKEMSGIVIFHNGVGTMCLEALEFFKENGYEYIEYKTDDEGFEEKFLEYRAGFTTSEGLSNSFGYYPIIFVKDRAFSGFNALIEDSIESIVEWK